MSEAERVQIMTQLPERKAVWGRPASRCAGKPTH
jgi:hypothetical protein